MSFLYEAELSQQAEHFIECLENEGFQAVIVTGSFRDYTVKVSVGRQSERFGVVNLYYSPKKQRFSLGTHELKNPQIAPVLQTCWQRTVDVSESTGAAGTEIYVDGSYVNEVIGYAWVLLIDGKLVQEEHGLVSEPELQPLRQVAGELMATMKAVAWSVAHGIRELSISYDYDGIEKWATGEWQARRPFSLEYANFIDSAPVTIKWRKVASHSGDYWNDYVDHMASLAGRSQQPAEANDLLSVLEKTATSFVVFLKETTMDARLDGIFNDQFARVTIHRDGRLSGYFDLYNTRKKSLAPRLHDFIDKELQAKVQQQWELFHTEQHSEVRSQQSVIGEVEYYYQALRPYRNYAFDFSELAEALDRVLGDKSDTDLFDYRYDFDRLEAVYFTLRGKNHG